MDIELLQRVKAHILEEPSRFIMGDWIVDLSHPDSCFVDSPTRTELGPEDEWPPCKTAACISGWSVLLGRYGGDPQKLYEEKGRHYPYLEEDGADVLGLSELEAHRLFFTRNWPIRFTAAWLGATTREERAQVAASRIDFFIRTHGTDSEAEDTNAL